MSHPTKRLATLATGILLAASGLFGGVVAPAAAAPVEASDAAVSVGDPVVGIPKPCATSHEWPSDASLDEIKTQLASNTGIKLVGSGWTDPANRPMVKIVWQTLEALSCTDYVTTITSNHPDFTLNASAISGWAFGDWGLTRPGAVTIDFAKWQAPYQAGDKGRLVRLFVHELGHAYSRTPEAQKAYNRFGTLYAATGNFSDYGRGSANENFSEVVGYYVARCAAQNPYDAKVRNQGQFDKYYELVKEEVFDGREFGPGVGKTPDCSLTPRTTPSPEPRAAQEPIKRVPSESVATVNRVPKTLAAETTVTRVLKESLDR
ncbi:hypothetical protein ACTQ49_10330 [Luteococcus sp. Sow4_B9]|uniref:hypothetical protein n=1 Tax=Luteococcus sp. Sow4_B9 TaxID=3438792 RepID=UPI003F99A16A